MFDFLKRNKQDSPPDIGQEESPEEKKAKKSKLEEEEESEEEEDTESEDDSSDEETGEEDDEETEYEEEPKKSRRKIGRKTGKKELKRKIKKISRENVRVDNRSFEIEKLNAKIEALDALMKGYSERFSQISQQIGEVRAMNLSNEKSVAKAIQESEKASDIVSEVKPEKLRIENQKLDMRINSIEERITANQQFQETIMNELKDLRRKAGIFVGTDALLRLNEDVKKDLIEVQKLGNKTRINADKSEQIFVELKKEFSESQKLNEIAGQLDTSYAGLKKEVEKMKLDYSNIVNQNEFNDFKKTFNNKFLVVEDSLSDIENMKPEIERLVRLVETIALVSRKNKEDIADIAVTIGDDHVERISDYENQISSILRIIDALAGQVSIIKEKLGIKTKKIPVLNDNKKIIENKNIKMNHMEIHPKVAETLAVKNHEIPRKIKKSTNIKEEDNFLESIKKSEEKEIPEIKENKTKIISYEKKFPVENKIKTTHIEKKLPAIKKINIIHHDKIAPYKIKKIPLKKITHEKRLPVIKKTKIIPLEKKLSALKKIKVIFPKKTISHEKKKILPAKKIIKKTNKNPKLQNCII